MPHVDIDPENPADVLIATNYQDRFLIKQLPGARWDGNRKIWKANLSWSTCIILRGLFQKDLTIGDELSIWARNEKATRVNEANRLRDLLELEDDDQSEAANVIRSWRGTGKYDMRSFQEAGVRYLHAAISAGLTDPMGSGKTIQGIGVLRLMHELGEDPFPALIVCPNSVKTSWAKEFPIWWPQANVQMVHGGAGTRRTQLQSSADVYVINWEALRGHSRLAGYGSYALRGCVECDATMAESLKNAEQHLHTIEAEIEMAQEASPELEGEEPEEAKEISPELKEALDKAKGLLATTKRQTAHSTCEKCPRELNEIPWKVVIADEAHRAKDPRAKQTRALWATSRPAVRRIFMTGTPIANRPDELWSPLNFMDPREWPSKSKYVDYFTNKQFNFWGGMEILGLKAETKPQLFQILDPRMRRMPKEIILPQLPPKVMITREAEMSAKQARAYKQMVDEMIAELEDETSHDDKDVQHAQFVTAANPLTRSLRLLQFASSYAVKTAEGTVVLDEPSGKLDVLDEIIEETEGEQLVVFAASKQLIMLAAARAEKNKIPFGLITGDIGVPERQVVVDDFQSGKLRMVLATMGAGGTGITLTAARTLVRLQRDWNAVNNSQAEDRIHRIGSEIHESVDIIDIVTPDTVEIHQLEVLEGKYGNLQEIVRDKESLRRLLSGK